MMKRLAAITLLPLVLAACATQASQPPEPPRAPAEKRKIMISIPSLIFMRMREKGCWNEKAVAEETARATFRVYFTSDSHLSKPPELIAPIAPAQSDPSLAALIGRAKKALEACDAQGFDLPTNYNGLSPPPYWDLTFPDRFAY